MNSLLVCPQCNGAISRATQTCPSCGAVTNHRRARSGFDSSHQAVSQSVITIVIDALRTRPGRRRPTTEPISRIMSDS